MNKIADQESPRQGRYVKLTKDEENHDTDEISVDDREVVETSNEELLRKCEAQSRKIEELEETLSRFKKLNENLQMKLMKQKEQGEMSFDP